MPCNDWGSGNTHVVEVESGAQTSRLCAVFRVLEQRGILEDVLKSADWREAGVSLQGTQDWWKRHKRADIERQERERQERIRARKREEARQKAKATLTREERQLLGIKD